MDTVNALKGYDKVGSAAEHRRRRLGIAAVFLVVLLFIAAIVSFATVFPNRNKPPAAGEVSSPAQSLSAVCRFASDFNSCVAILSAAGANSSSDPEDIFLISLKIAQNELSRVSAKGVNDLKPNPALDDCKEMFNDAIGQLNSSIQVLNREISPGEKILTDSRIADLRTWLSAALTDLDTCLDSLEEIGGGIKEKMEMILRNSTIFIKNSLAIIAHIGEIFEILRVPVHRKLLSHA